MRGEGREFKGFMEPKALSHGAKQMFFARPSLALYLPQAFSSEASTRKNMCRTDCCQTPRHVSTKRAECGRAAAVPAAAKLFFLLFCLCEDKPR